MRRGSVARCALVLAAAFVAVVAGAGCAPSRPDSPEVVVYTSVDQVFAEPVFKDFEARSGIRVRAVYDAEAAKTTGLVNRLIAEKGRPRADVWWSGEIAQTHRLARAGVLAAYASPGAKDLPANLRGEGDLWTGFGGRLRVFLVNTNASVRAPASFDDLRSPPPGTDPARVGMSNPVFGTASTQAAVLYAVLGREDALSYYKAVRDAGVRILPGNGDVRDLVVSGELDWGLTDSDDALGAIDKGAPVRVVVPGQDGGDVAGGILIPNTVAVVAGGPDATSARRLVDYLLSAHAERLMVERGWIQYPVRGAPDRRVVPGDVRLLDVDWEKTGALFEASAEDMKELFIR